MTAACVTGDATSAAAWTAALGGARADLLLTDPPYCLLTRRRKGGDPRDPKGKKNDASEVVGRFESVRAYRDFPRAWLERAVAHLSPAAPLVIWTNLLGRAPIVEVAAALGYGARWGEFVWAKRTREKNSGEELLRMVETALVLGRAARPLPAPADPATPWAVVAGYDDDGEAERWGSHPNHKPFGVLEPLVRTWSRPGQRVVDCFAGSGSIPAAALKLGRVPACIELQPAWAAKVTARLREGAP